MSTWINGIEVGWINGKCVKCKLSRTKEGHDPCIERLPNVKNACCGHGESRAYCQWADDEETRYWIEMKEGLFIEDDSFTSPLSPYLLNGYKRFKLK